MVRCNWCLTERYWCESLPIASRLGLGSLTFPVTGNTYQNTSLSEIHKLKQVETYKTMVLEWRLGWTWCIFAAFAGLGLARRWWPGAAAASRCHKPYESSLHATGGDAVSPGLLQRWLHFWGRGKSWDLPDREGLTCSGDVRRLDTSRM